MIGKFFRLWPQPGIILRLGLITAVLAVGQGLLLGLLVPILRALLQPEPDFAAATPWLITGAIGLLGYWILSVIATPIGFAAGSEMAIQLRRRLMRHVTDLPLGQFSGERKTEFTRTVTAVVGGISHMAVTTGQPALTAMLVPTTIIGVTAFVDWRMALLFLAAIPLALLALRRSGRVASTAISELEDAETDIAGRAVEYGQVQPVLRAAGHGSTGSVRMRQALDDHRERYRVGLNRLLVPDLTYSGVMAIGFAAILVVGARFLLGGSLSTPDAVALLVLAIRFVEPLGTMADQVAGLRAIEHGIERVENVLRIPALEHRENPVTEVTGSDIEFSEVTFSYGSDGEQGPALADVSFNCPSGTTTALVGPSGSGKTTVTRLIARFFDIESGAVRIGGVDVRDYDHATLLSNIAIVFQDVYLFDTTVEENLRVARPEATHEELMAAARAARLDEVIDRLPDGWNTRVGEGGGQFSGGERQRVSIARAFLKDARIVLIDEAGSALDPENEDAVSRAIIDLARDPSRTVIVIAHRPATLAAADRVVALDGGRVVETGTPAELMAADGAFAQLHRSRENAQNWSIVESGSVLPG